jgi:TrmH family RNA methyltransferase
LAASPGSGWWAAHAVAATGVPNATSAAPARIVWRRSMHTPFPVGTANGGSPRAKAVRCVQRMTGALGNVAAMIRISSTRNPRILAALELAKSRERERRGEFAVEGAREIGRALAAGLAPVEAFWTPSLSAGAAAVVDALRAVPGIRTAEVTQGVFDRLVVRDGADGVYVVFARPPALALADLALPAAPLLLAVQGVEKPGNLGALLRVADGAGVDAVVALDGTADPTNPNLIRASLGTVFALPLVGASSADFRAWAGDNGIAVYAAALADRAVPYAAADYAGGAAILLGSEARGLDAYWLDAADRVVRIPMAGVADSLNVATAGAVLLYEAVRQRSARQRSARPEQG